MGSSAKCKSDYVKYKFDLKGSLVKRETFGNLKNTTILKDKNIIKIKQSESCLLFNPDEIPDIMRQMGSDVSLLSHFNLMDYSLLFVIEYNPTYVEKYPHEFLHDEKGELVLPVRPTKQAMKKI
jgi:hypothetical protein